MTGSPFDRTAGRGGDEVRSLRDDMDHLPGQTAGQRRLVCHSHRVFPAFNSLEIGIDAETALAYLKKPFDACRVPAEERGRLLGVMLAFGITCVEAERERVAAVEKEGAPP
jgi:hypothetical protein